MSLSVLIPDDYTLASNAIAFLHDTPGVTTRALGDLARVDAAGELSTADALILIRERTRIDAAFLQAAPQLKVISQTGKVARNIDLDACTRAGVAVLEGIGSPTAPAELAWLLIMASRRCLVDAVNGMKAGQWQTAIGETVAGQTLGILGFGKIGKKVASFGAAFGMTVLVWGSERARREARESGYEVAVSREALFAGADVLSVHQRLVAETSAGIGAADLAAMKPTALFVNISRAELVEAGALQAALSAGRPGFAALDVFESEPVYAPDHPLLAMPNVLCTPHIGYAEKTSYQLYFRSAFDNLLAFFAGDHSGVINPAALTVKAT